MSEYKGVLHETTAKFPDTDIWIDSCGEEELNYGLERGITGATSNPIIVGAVIKNELEFWKPTIINFIKENPGATEDEITWMLLYKVGEDRSKKLLPVYEKYNAKKGYLSVQVNAKYYRSKDKMLEQAMKIHSLGENMQVKMPASQAGIEAMEEATYRGCSINATVSFTVAQAVAVAEAVERGLARRKAEGLDCSKMAPVCTLMIGRTDDWLKASCTANNLAIKPEAAEWAGVAVIKEAYRIYNEKGYTTRLLSAANRNVYHWSEIVGGNLCQTINYSWHKILNDSCDMPVVSRIDEPVPAEWMDELNRFEEFKKSFDVNALKPEDFVNYGGFKNTISTFLGGYDDLVKLIRGLMI